MLNCLALKIMTKMVTLRNPRTSLAIQTKSKINQTSMTCMAVPSNLPGQDSQVPSKTSKQIRSKLKRSRTIQSLNLTLLPTLTSTSVLKIRRTNTTTSKRNPLSQQQASWGMSSGSSVRSQMSNSTEKSTRKPWHESSTHSVLKDCHITHNPQDTPVSNLVTLLKLLHRTQLLNKRMSASRWNHLKLLLWSSMKT